MTVRVGVLHTVPALVPVFDALLKARRDDLDIIHVADASLLADAVAAGGVTNRVRDGLDEHLRALRDAGAESVLVTCSSIGEAADAAGGDLGVAVTRVDAAMAAAAVARATSQGAESRILVLATLAATLGPTNRLVESAAGEAGVRVEATVIAGAADARAAGDLALHDRLVGAAVRESGADVIVLAQASMAPAAGDDPRVLTSPESGAAAVVASLGMAPPATGAR